MRKGRWDEVPPVGLGMNRAGDGAPVEDLGMDARCRWRRQRTRGAQRIEGAGREPVGMKRMYSGDLVDGEARRSPFAAATAALRDVERAGDSQASLGPDAGAP